MRTIAIINQKGGCGKTTTAINLAAVLADKGHKTLLVDMDPQSHCALGLAVPDAQLDRSIADLLRVGLDGTMAFGDVTWQVSRNLDLAPSSMSLAGLEVELTHAIDKDRRLAQVLSTVSDIYEFCIVDCPPSISLLTFNALRAADEVIIPVETGYFSMQGAVRQEATIQMLARRVNHGVRMSVLATMYDVRTKLAREILTELRRHFGQRLLPIVVNFNSKLKEAASFGQPITEYDPGSRGMQDFERLANWLISHPPVREPMPADANAHGIAETAGAPGTTETADLMSMLATNGAAGTASTSDTRGNHAAIAAGMMHSSTNRTTATTGASAPPVANPALSRAAELVERARALAARTAALASRLADDPDTRAAPAIANALAHPATHAGTLAAKLATVYGVRCTSQGVLFVQPAGRTRHVFVAGDFNGWSPSASPLRRDERLGVFQACLPVPPGRYRYRLIVDGRWVHDPYNTYVESNPFGELNNILEVAE